MPSDMLQKIAQATNQQQSTGRSDSIPAEIDGNTPAALSEGEYVLPADVVSKLGAGSTDAGARILDSFISKIRTENSSEEGMEEGNTIQDLIKRLISDVG